jgi:hypothetical protein
MRAVLQRSGSGLHVALRLSYGIGRHSTTSEAGHPAQDVGHPRRTNEPVLDEEESFHEPVVERSELLHWGGARSRVRRREAAGGGDAVELHEENRAKETAIRLTRSD